jgi:hypothetical protein
MLETPKALLIKIKRVNIEHVFTQKIGQSAGNQISFYN